MTAVHMLLWLESLAVLTLAVAIVVARVSHLRQRWLQVITVLAFAGMT